MFCIADGCHLSRRGFPLETRPARRRPGTVRRPPRTWRRPRIARADDVLAPATAGGTVTLSEIASHLGTSPRTLNRRFREQAGTTPLQWLLRQRAPRSCWRPPTCRSRQSPSAAGSAPW
ncbi:AraC family transcriptional regulator [Catenulispora subtropica]|uniref:helix-turn-helix domain-containing protein n=1 Tax=Catenulispora subtropica TaxID=450798 RepID=UPI003CD05FA5